MDEDLKLIYQKLATLEANQVHIMNNLPKCEKENIKESIIVNRKLIYLIFASYIPMLIGIYFKIGG
jgi:hypothetical protein